MCVCGLDRQAPAAVVADPRAARGLRDGKHDPRGAACRRARSPRPSLRFSDLFSHLLPAAPSPPVRRCSSESLSPSSTQRPPTGPCRTGSTIWSRPRRDRAEIAPRSRRDRAEIGPVPDGESDLPSWLTPRVAVCDSPLTQTTGRRSSCLTSRGRCRSPSSARSTQTRTRRARAQARAGGGGVSAGG